LGLRDARVRLPLDGGRGGAGGSGCGAFGSSGAPSGGSPSAIRAAATTIAR
jgi:hypothetical protein